LKQEEQKQVRESSSKEIFEQDTHLCEQMPWIDIEKKN
jgi:hypothetical protein